MGKKEVRMTVKELKRRLTELMKQGHGDAEIIMEGCDCNAPCNGVYVAGPPHRVVYLER